MGNPKKLFSQIYDTYINKIYKFVFLKVNSQEIAEDLTSEAFSRTWVVFKEKQDDIKNVRAFLYKTANNLVIDHYRKKAKINTMSVGNHNILGIADPKQDLERNILIDSDMEVVRHALLNLKKDYQNIVIWHYLEDLSITEISELLNRSESATRVLLHRALKALKAKVKQV